MLVSAICQRALRLAGIFGTGDAAPSAEDMDEAVSALNEMLLSWELEGMALGHSYTAISTDTFLVDEAYHKAIRYCLAVDLAGSYDRQDKINAAIVQTAIMEKEKVRAALCDIDILNCDSALIGPKLTFNHTTGQ